MEGNTWLNDKMNKCKHPMNGKDLNMGSCGGMFATQMPDGSMKPSLIFVECYKCGFAYVSHENPPGSANQGEQMMVDLINSFHNMRYDRLKNKNELRTCKKT